jgi:hypothetical protein
MSLEMKGYWLKKGFLLVIKNPEYLKSDQKIKQNTTAKTTIQRVNKRKTIKVVGGKDFFFTV